MLEMELRRVQNGQVEADDFLLEFHEEQKQTRTIAQRLTRFAKMLLILFLIITITLFVIIFVVLPIIFMCFVSFQRIVMFMTFDGEPKNPEFGNFEKYGIQGARNFHLTVYSDQAVSLGTWHILPQGLVNKALLNPNFDYTSALASGEYDVVLYFHGTGGHRITPIHMYEKLRQFFHVIAFDYRGYADSTMAVLSEEGVVLDCIQVYRWLLTKANAKIYVWGHSLGTALSTHTVARLRDENVVPSGLILEAPFTNMREELLYNFLSKKLAWLPWFSLTIQDPLENNGFRFMTTTNILKIDCPIMILHAEDDQMVPSILGSKLYEVAQNAHPGVVRLHLFPGSFRYNHMGIYNAPELLSYVADFIKFCQETNAKRG